IEEVEELGFGYLVQQVELLVHFVIHVEVEFDLVVLVVVDLVEVEVEFVLVEV
ncbi:hypothetical protein A2U01_0093995, partial [Trifolium medium]|nr:hypothetical protein [Trifolium medium]